VFAWSAVYSSIARPEPTNLASKGKEPFQPRCEPAVRVGRLIQHSEQKHRGRANGDG